MSQSTDLDPLSHRSQQEGRVASYVGSTVSKTQTGNSAQSHLLARCMKRRRGQSGSYGTNTWELGKMGPYLDTDHHISQVQHNLPSADVSLKINL